MTREICTWLVNFFSYFYFHRSVSLTQPIRLAGRLGWLVETEAVTMCTCVWPSPGERPHATTSGCASRPTCAPRGGRVACLSPGHFSFLLPSQTSRLVWATAADAPGLSSQPPFPPAQPTERRHYLLEHLQFTPISKYGYQKSSRLTGYLYLTC